MKSRSTDKSKLPDAARTPAADSIREQLGKILDWPEFQKSRRLRDFLAFVVTNTLEGNADSLKAYTIGLEVFDRPENFDPVTDTIVRVNAGKLRRALERYYLGLGRQDRVLISIPKGRYVPVFENLDFGEKRKLIEPTAAACDLSIIDKYPTIAVLPLKMTAAESDFNFLVNGLGEELAMALSRFGNLSVISYHSSAKMKSDQQGIEKACRTLSATFVLTGSVYQITDNLRLNIQLVRADNYMQVWSRRYEQQLSNSDLFSIVDDIVQQTVAFIADDYGVIPRIVASASREKPLNSLNAYEAILRYHDYGVTLDFSVFAETLTALECAVADDPEYSIAWAALSILYLDSYTLGFGSIDEPLDKAEQAIQEAIKVDPSCQHVYYGMCYLNLLRRQKRNIIQNAEKMVQLNPNAGFLVGVAGWFLALAGEFDEGFSTIEKSQRLNPVTPSWFHFPYFLFNYQKGDYDQALESAKLFGLHDFFWNPLIHAAAYGKLGKIDKARAALRRLLLLKPDFPQRARYYISSFIISDNWVTNIIEGLREAGLSEG